MCWIIYADSSIEGIWFKNRSSLLKNAQIKIILRKNNPLYIQKLLRYDRPDIILVKGNIPKLVIEKTREVPTGHNVGQRFGRIVNAAEESIPTIFFLPFKAMKHGKYKSLCNVPKRLFDAIERIEAIHETPIILVEWISDNHNEIITDGSENKQLESLLNDLLINDFNFKKTHQNQKIKEHNRKFCRHLVSSTSNLPNSVSEKNTNEYVELLIKRKKINRRNDLSEDLLNRTKTFVYKIGMTESKCKRQDPYTGQQFIYDYQFCRNGTDPAMKENNLVLYFPFITKKTWLKNNPNSRTTKSSLWYVTANLMEFKDGIYTKEQWGRVYFDD